TNSSRAERADLLIAFPMGNEPMRRIPQVLLLALGVWFSRSGARGADSPPGRRADQEALKAYAPLVGAWRGTGQPQRGSIRGAWTEKVGWAWRLSTDRAALELMVERGKYLKSARLRPGPDPGT